MTDHQPVHDMLGHAAPDAGCDACFRLMDEVAEAQGAGMDISRRFPEVAAHVRDCAACRQDLEGLIAYLEDDADGRSAPWGGRRHHRLEADLVLVGARVA